MEKDICTKCGEPIEEGELRQDENENIICEDCFVDLLGQKKENKKYITIRELKEELDRLGTSWDDKPVYIVDTSSDHYKAYHLAYIEADPSENCLDLGVNLEPNK